MVGCGAQERLPGSSADGLTQDEIAFVAWWVEDVAHGGLRKPDELIRTDSSPGMTKLAQWAYGRIYNDQSSEGPPIIRQRRLRWPLIAAAVRQGAIQFDEEGLPYLVTVDRETSTLLAAAVSDERDDRLKTFTTLLAVGEISPGSPAATFAADQLRDARAQHRQGLLP
jgi:hypothetical protein